MGPAHPRPTRKRNRKRKRRIVSDSSSSEEDSSTSSNASTPEKTVTAPVRQLNPALSENADSDENENETSSSSSADSPEDSETGDEGVHAPMRSSRPGHSEPSPQRDSPSPQPNVDIPPFIPENAQEGERVFKERFRKFWMASIAKGFEEDLEEIRKEPNLGSSRLALLIESLASGADVFSSSGCGGGVNEMEVVLDQLP